jgi:aminopeptidase N
MLSKEYLDTARTILRAAQTMTDQHVAGQLKALAEDYERRAEKAAHADAAKALARSAARECEALSLSAQKEPMTCAIMMNGSPVYSGAQILAAVELI